MVVVSSTSQTSANKAATVIQESSLSPGLVFVVKILFVLVLLLLLPRLVDGGGGSSNRRRRRRQLELKALRKECYNECFHLLPEESTNCLLECTSPTCYDKIYATSPLEDGELDFERYKQFDKCFKQDLKEQRRAQKQQQDTQ